ncbi:MFS transporter [Sphaerisporangium perillae]|uniref:MFS transporter n=1 Tax=Sphaerisporangium perillae TaxID=2935860 RepID=UPI00200DB400|nr:MFS transporter [Sphaerisporangium perillae]
MTQDTPLEASGTATATALARPRKLFTPSLALFNFGAAVAVLTPVRLTLALKVQELVGNQDKAAALGLVTAVGAVFAIICSPLAGRLSDRTTSRFGMRRPWIIGGATGGAVCLLVIGAADSLWMVVLGWCLAEVFINSATAAATATVADQVPPEGRGRVSGIVGLGLPAAVLTGSVIVNAFASSVTRFVVPGALMLVFAVLLILNLSDRRLHERPAKFDLKEFASSFVFNPRRNPDFGWLWIGRFAVMFGSSGVQTYQVYLLTDRFGLSGSALTGVIVMANTGAAIAMIVSSYLMGMLSDRLRRRKPFVAAGSVFIALGLAMIAFAPDPTLVIAAGPVVGFGAAGFLAVDLALATQVLPDRGDTAKDLGVLVITNGLPQSVVPVIAPAVIAMGTASISGYSLLYVMGAVSAILGAVCVYRIKGVR